eukprot:Lithocolla_globosa_v1_NODE_11319_length_518_cov_2.358531.p1 type:complete len:127 gc:universal NODE_11319_length_518_cov_2.358531:393-13(-)
MTLPCEHTFAVKDVLKLHNSRCPKCRKFIHIKVEKRLSKEWKLMELLYPEEECENRVLKCFRGLWTSVSPALTLDVPTNTHLMIVMSTPIMSKHVVSVLATLLVVAFECATKIAIAVKLTGKPYRT